MLEKVLIANRGEIALRIARTCREMGIHTVVVHSTQDRDSAAVRFADESVQIGPAPASRSYLNTAAVLEAAVRSGATAIHPGYGFLSEDPYFADACEQTGFTLIGPPAEVMARLGDKTSARAAMVSAGLPLLPGSVEALDAASARELAEEIGFPVILKAVAGGGGRGMAVVREPSEFAAAYRRTQAAAQALFGDGRIYLEKYLERARHVEVQILADGHGDVLHLAERDCTAQRRHQKLVEETPAPGLPESLRADLRQAAVAGAKATGYVGAGTFEFLVQDDAFYFMEVNCRIQVEHPVTEMVTGIDLVREQIRIARGEPLGLRQQDVRPGGVAIECRINAEDPAADFRPAPGTLTAFVPPGGPFVRVDTHACTGYRVPPHYDSLLAKLVVWGSDRDEAIARMRHSIEEFRIEGDGVRTTSDFLRRLIDDKRFRMAEHTTRFAEELELYSVG